MKKGVRVDKKLNNASYEVLKMLQQRLSITEISKARKVSRQATYKTLYSLIRKGWVANTSWSVYELTQEGVKGLHSSWGSRNKVRQHNLHFKIKVLNSPKNWALRRNELKFLPYFNKAIKLRNNEQELFNFGRLSIKTTSKSVIIKMPHIYSVDWEDALIQAMSILEGVIPKIESSFRISLVKGHKSEIKIISQEYAKVQDALAKLYRVEGNRIYLTGDDGKIWMITDFSFSTDETEFIHPNRATDDLDAIGPFLNDLRKNPTTITEMRSHVGELQAVVTSHARNEVKHQKVLDEILLTFKKLNARLDKAGL